MTTVETILFSYLLGLAASLSLCVVPLLPLSVVMITDSERNLSRGVIAGLSVTGGVLASFLVFALFCSYISLFLISNYVVISFVLGVVMSSFGLIALSPANKKFARVHEATRRAFYQLRIREGSIVWAFAAGFLFSIISAPCGASVYLSAIVIASVEESILSRLLMAAMFSIGVGTIFISMGVLLQQLHKTNPDRFIKVGFTVGKIATVFIVALGFYMMVPFLMSFM